MAYAPTQRCTRCKSACCLPLGFLLDPRLCPVRQIHNLHVVLHSCVVECSLYEKLGLETECLLRLCWLFEVLASADVSGHLPAVFYISCEPFDNSLRALKGIADPSKRKIIAIFQLAKPSHPLGRVRCGHALHNHRFQRLHCSKSCMLGE